MIFGPAPDINPTANADEFVDTIGPRDSYEDDRADREADERRIDAYLQRERKRLGPRTTLPYGTNEVNRGAF